LRRALKWLLVLTWPVLGNVDSMVMTAVVDAMESMYGDPVSVNATWAFTDSRYPDFDVQSVRLASPHPIYAGSNESVSLVMLGDSGSVIEPIKLDIVVRVPVVVMQQSVAPGAVVQPSDIQITMASVDTVPSNAVRSSLSIVGKKARSRLLSGRMVTLPMLHDSDRVTAGQSVRVILESEAIAIETRGIARHDAPIGDWVGIELNNGTMLEAKVRDDQTVVIRN